MNTMVNGLEQNVCHMVVYLTKKMKFKKKMKSIDKNKSKTHSK